MDKQITHIEWIDGAKGIAILSVILQHSLPCLLSCGFMWHIGQAVPVFLFITAYLISIRFDSLRTYFTWCRLSRLTKKIVVPFLIVLAFQLLCYVLSDNIPSLKTIIKNGGLGPGSYYVWLYLQICIIIPFIVLLVRKVPIWGSLLIMLTISILAEYIFVPIQDIENIDKLYRLMPNRYLMVLYLGCVWPLLKEKQKYLFYGLACLAAILLVNGIYVNLLNITANTPPRKNNPSILAWFSLVYIFLCSVSYFCVTAYKIFINIQNSRTIQLVYFPFANDVFWLPANK
jgi:fucose 4-O-acetylase-like acetyltransferase